MKSCCNSNCFCMANYKAKTIKLQVVKSVLLLALFDHIKSVDSQRTVTSEFYTHPDTYMLVNNLMVKLFLKYRLQRKPGGPSICLTT